MLINSSKVSTNLVVSDSDIEHYYTTTIILSKSHTFFSFIINPTKSQTSTLRIVYNTSLNWSQNL